MINWTVACGMQVWKCECGATGSGRSPAAVRSANDHVMTYHYRLKCICFTQGADVYRSDCPIHDRTVDRDDEAWQRRYDHHHTAAELVRKRLGQVIASKQPDTREKTPVISRFTE